MTQIRFPADHPTSDGHFPGNPILPGAVLLDEVVAAIAAGLDADPSHYEIRSAKFLNPVRPGDQVSIRWRDAADGEMRFECLSSETEKPVVTGVIVFDGLIG